MKKILLVKITSMGDLIQMLPALTDAAKAIPGIQFDWVAEESFKEVPQLHPNINKIITLPYRSWKKHGINWQEVKAFWRNLRAEKYDMVIDAQSNLKSAFVTKLARGKKYGLDGKSVREYGAHFFYNNTIAIDRKQNHAQRMRQLMANFLEYPVPDTVADYGIINANLPPLSFQLPEKFVFITHLCSCKDRLWPEPYWETLIDSLVQQGYAIVLPWWSEEEKARAERLKKNRENCHLIPPLTLSEKACVLAKATAAISVDTGLAHMAAALNVPNVGLYGPTNPAFTGAWGQNQVHLQATGPACVPCLKTTCSYQGPSQFRPACLETIKPDVVLDALNKIMNPQ